MKSKKSKWIENYKILLMLTLILVVSSLLFTQAEPEDEPVIITNIQQSNIQDSRATITWETNVLSDSLIKYGKTQGNYEFEEISNPTVYNHSMILEGLEHNTTYYFVINSTSPAGHSNETEEFMFTTLEDTTPPMWSEKTDIPVSRNVYNAVEYYNFSMKWTDNTEVDIVIVTHNFSGTEETLELQGQESVYAFYVQNLAAGTYYWNMHANDTFNNINQTINFEYKVDPASPELKLFINGEESSTSIYQENTINISVEANNNQGTVEIFIDGILLSSGTNESNASQHFSSPGNYTIIAVYNSTQNYTQQNISYTLEVNEVSAILGLTKQQYSISELAGYTVHAPDNSNMTAEICGPLPQGQGFAECYETSYVGINFPYAVAHKHTNKTGTYTVKIDVKHKNLTLTDQKNYTVVNSITNSIQGPTKIKVNEETNITATAIGGVSPYTYKWVLYNGTIINGQSLKIKYGSTGSYPVKLSVKDAYGNEKNDTTTINVRKHFTLNVKVRNNDDNKAINLAEVRIDGTEKFTNSNGDVSFELFEDEYNVRVFADGYENFNQYVTLNETQTLDVYMTKKGQSAASSSSSNKIELISPLNNAALGTRTVNFEATIYPDVELSCILYLALTGDEWFREAQKYTVKETQKITYSEVLEENKEYSWKVQCKTALGVTYNSDTIKFTTSGNVATQSGVIDAGEIRLSIEDALNNFDSFDMSSKQVAEALQFTQQIEKSLTSYDRIMRDINSLLYRRDLSASEIEKKTKEYYENIYELEKNTISNINAETKESFVIYPKREDLSRIADLYKESKQMIGTPDISVLESMQNGVVVKTRVSHAELTYLDGSRKRITLIEKELSYSGEIPESVFIVEEIPKELAKTTAQMTIITQHSVINKDPLLRFNKPKQIVYYFEDYKDVELTKTLHTILFREDVYGSRNSITGNITLSNIEVTSTTWLIILLIVLAGAYIIYSFDLVHKVLGQSSEKQTSQIRMMINDAFDYLESKDVPKANLIFKEIRMSYETAHITTKHLVYSEAMKLHDTINMKFMDAALDQARNAIAGGDINAALKNYSLLDTARKNMGATLSASYASQINGLRNNLLHSFPAYQNEILNIERGSL